MEPFAISTKKGIDPYEVDDEGSAGSIRRRVSEFSQVFGICNLDSPPNKVATESRRWTLLYNHTEVA